MEGVRRRRPGAIQRLDRDEEGSIMVLTAVMVLLLVKVALSAYNVGFMTAQRIRLQVVADTAAYSTATWQARFMNYCAYTRRAMIANVANQTLTTAAESNAKMLREYDYSGTRPDIRGKAPKGFVQYQYILYCFRWYGIKQVKYPIYPDWGGRTFWNSVTGALETPGDALMVRFWVNAMSGLYQSPGGISLQSGARATADHLNYTLSCSQDMMYHYVSNPWVTIVPSVVRESQDTDTRKPIITVSPAYVAWGCWSKYLAYRNSEADSPPPATDTISEFMKDDANKALIITIEALSEFPEFRLLFDRIETLLRYTFARSSYRMLNRSTVSPRPLSELADQVDARTDRFTSAGGMGTDSKPRIWDSGPYVASRPWWGVSIPIPNLTAMAALRMLIQDRVFPQLTFYLRQQARRNVAFEYPDGDEPPKVEAWDGPPLKKDLSWGIAQKLFSGNFVDALSDFLDGIPSTYIAPRYFPSCLPIGFIDPKPAHKKVASFQGYYDTNRTTFYDLNDPASEPSVYVALSIPKDELVREGGGGFLFHHMGLPIGNQVRAMTAVSRAQVYFQPRYSEDTDTERMYDSLLLQEDEDYVGDRFQPTEKKFYTPSMYYPYWEARLAPFWGPGYERDPAQPVLDNGVSLMAALALEDAWRRDPFLVATWDPVDYVRQSRGIHY